MNDELAHAAAIALLHLSVTESDILLQRRHIP